MLLREEILFTLVEWVFFFFCLAPATLLFSVCERTHHEQDGFVTKVHADLDGF